MDLQKRLAVFKNITLDGYSCTNPIIDVKTITGVDIACIKPDGTVVVYVVPDEIACLEAWIRCSNCLDCPPLRVVKCFCDDHFQCPSCHRCNEVDKVCEDICPTGVCSGDECVECNELHPCKNGKVCNQGKCECPPGWRIDQFGICRRCIESTDCNGCEVCSAYDCVAKTCAVGYLNPETCECKQCWNNSHCLEENTCCDANGMCNCCTGYYRDPITGKCIAKPPCTAGQCPPCYECTPDGCAPTSCLPGRVHVGSDCCQLVCDCSNPSCPPGYTCVRKGLICICVNCDVACTTVGGCPEGCECKDFNRCGPKAKDPCDAYCDENTPCAKGCGCNLLTKRCENCNTRNCTTPNCEELVGCKCRPVAVGNLSQSCQEDPCNSPCTKPEDCADTCGCNKNTGRCNECDRPCENNGDCEWGCYCDKGVKRCKKNPCAGSCVNGGQCQTGCGCWEDKGCYPCDSFDCTTCAQVNGCDCPAGVCEEHKKLECLDELKIVKDNLNCKLEGRLTTQDCCGCPDIGYALDISVDSTGLISFNRKLRKGHNQNSILLDMTGIYKDFPPNLGVNNIEIKAFYSNGSEDTIQTFTEDWGYVPVNNLQYAYQSACALPVVNATVIRYDFIIKTDIDFTFENNCKYFIPAGTKVSVAGCGATKSAVIPLVKRAGCKLPLFTWYKGTALSNLVKAREAYALKVGNFYRDIFGAAEGLEIGKYVKLLTDCGCDKDTFFSCWGDESRPTKVGFCQPPNLVVTPNQSLCNTEITIDEATVCSLYEGKVYELWINGSLYGSYTVTSGKLFTGGITINYGVPVTEVRLKVPGDECNICDIVKTFSINNPCNCSVTPMSLSLIGIPSCTTGFQYELTGGTAPYRVVVVRTIPPIDHEVDSFIYDAPVPNTFTFAGMMESGDWYVKVTDAFGCEQRLNFSMTCCDLGNPNVNYDCDLQQIVVNSLGSIPTEYSLNGTDWYLLGATKRIASVLSNATYPGKVRLRRVDNHDCNTALDLVVNCDTCALTITSATLNTDCDEATIVSSPAWDEVSIGGTGAWAADTNPIALPSALAPGATETIYVRVAANPTCYKSITLKCNTCAAIDIGTPDIDLDCSNGELSITGLDDPTTPALPAGCSVHFLLKIDGVAQPAYTIPTGSWIDPIVIKTDFVLVKASTTLQVDIMLACPGQNCLLGSVTKTLTVVDDLGTVTYNCSGGSPGLQWTGGSTDVQVKIAGVWTTVLAGHLLSNGIYQIRTITDSEFCTVEKTITVNCSAGGGSGDPCMDFGDLFSITGDPCGSAFAIHLSGLATHTAAVTVRILESDFNNTCVNQSIWVSPTMTIAPGGTGFVSGVPITNRDRVIHYQLIGYPGDGCQCEVRIGECSNGAACGAVVLDPGDLYCTVVGGNRKVGVNNTNNTTVLVYIDAGSGYVYRGTVSPLAGATIDYEYPYNSTVSVRLVCLGDPTAFSSNESITLNC